MQLFFASEHIKMNIILISIILSSSSVHCIKWFMNGTNNGEEIITTVSGAGEDIRGDIE